MDDQLSGFGIGFRPPHYKTITDHLPPVDWFEITPENFMGGASRPHQFLEKLRSHYPIATHGVSLSITSLEPVDLGYLKSLANFISWLEPKIVSDHLCWTSYKGVYSHDLLPTPYTRSNLENVVSKIHQVQDVIKRQFVFENPSAYIAFSSNEMGEADFFAELVKQTGCGILLDINNAYVNWKNLGWEPISYFLKLPQDAVKQFHLAGHSVQEGVLIDTHDEPVCDGVWELYKKALSLWPKVPTLLEWDEKIPDFEILKNELNKARTATGTSEILNGTSEKKPRQNIATIHLSTIYEEFFKNVTDVCENAVQGLAERHLEKDTPVFSAKGLDIYKNAYFLRLKGVLKNLFPTLAWIAEEVGFEEIVAQYLQAFPSESHSINQIGQHLARFLESKTLEIDLGVPLSALRDIALLDWAHVEIFEMPSEEKFLTLNDLNSLSIESWDHVRFTLSSRIRIIDLEWDVGPTWKSVNRGEDPEKPLQKSCSYLVWQNNGSLQNQKLSSLKQTFLKCLEEGKSLKESVLQTDLPFGEAASILTACISEGLFTSQQLP